MASEIPVIPPGTRKVYVRFKRWRGSLPRRVGVPAPLWTAAAELAREHGIDPTAKALHLEHGKLMQRACVWSCRLRAMCTATPSSGVRPMGECPGPTATGQRSPGELVGGAPALGVSVRAAQAR